MLQYCPVAAPCIHNQRSMDRALVLALLLAASSRALAPTRRVARRVATRTYASDADDLLAEAERLRREAAALEATLPKREPVGRPEFVDEAPSYDGATIVVTGANGRLGSAVASALLERGASVRCVIRSSEPEAYGRLSYEVGAESLVGTIEAPCAPGSRAVFHLTSLRRARASPIERPRALLT